MTNYFDEKKQMITIIRALDRHITQIFEKRTDVSLTRFEILAALQCQGIVTHKDLQQTLAIDQAAVTRHLKMLEQQEYIERKRNEKNNREVLVAITEKGMALLQNCTVFKDVLMDELYEGFAEDDVQQFKQYLLRLYENTLKQ